MVAFSFPEGVAQDHAVWVNAGQSLTKRLLPATNIVTPRCTLEWLYWRPSRGQRPGPRADGVDCGFADPALPLDHSSGLAVDLF